jgi:ribose 5-phosphate isomerase A
LTDRIPSRLKGFEKHDNPRAYAAASATTPVSVDPDADKLANAAIEPIEGGMVVGLGTGPTTTRVIHALARKASNHHMDIRCVCSSLATEQLAQGVGLRVVSFADLETIDMMIDGANEMDGELRMLKGHHGAVTRQRLLAHAARRCVYLVHHERVVEHLGTKAPLSIVIIPFGIMSIRQRLRDMGLAGVLRRNMEGEVVVTDGGGVVIDAPLAGNNLEQLALDLNHVPGVVDHGLFLTEADEALIEEADGSVRRLRSHA